MNEKLNPVFQILYQVMLLMAVGPGCSLGKQDRSGIQVKLQPKPVVQHNWVKSISQSFQLVSNFADTVDDLNCFAVNVRGGSLPNNTFCNQIHVGEFDGPYDGIDTVFEPIVTLEDGLIFEAYGTLGGSCGGDGPENLGSADGVFKLGDVVANLGSGSKEINIPVTLDLNQAFGCDDGPFTVFTDPFDYAEPNLGATANWDDAGCAASSPIASNRVNLNPISLGSCSTMAHDIDFSKPFIRISLRVRADTDLTNGGVGPRVGIGVANGSAVGTTQGYGCKIEFSTNNDPTKVQYAVGDFPNSFDPVTSLSAINQAFVQDAIFSCEIQRETNGDYTINASARDPSGTVLLSSHTSVVTVNPSAETSDRVYIHLDGSAQSFGTTSYVDDLVVEQSNEREL